MKLTRLIIVGLIAFTGILKAQTDFRPGYILSIAGDTIYGEIDYRGDILMSSVCKFKNSDNTIVEYSPNDIMAYRFIDSKYYVSKEVDSNMVFLEYLIKGKISIYYLRDLDGEQYYLDKEKVALTEIPYEEGIKYKDDEQYFYSSTKHFGVLKYYMQDAPDMQKRIKRIRTPQNHNLIQLAEDYHNAVCDGEKCIIFEKERPLLSIDPEIVGGLINFKETKSKYFSNGGLITNIWLPGLSEKLYLRTGLLYSKTDLASESIYKIPLQLEYIYPKSIIRPKFSVGLNFFQPFHQTVGLMSGVNIKLHKLVYLSISCEMDFSPNEKIFLVPESRFSTNMLAGLYINI